MSSCEQPQGLPVQTASLHVLACSDGAAEVVGHLVGEADRQAHPTECPPLDVRASWGLQERGAIRSAKASGKSWLFRAQRRVRRSKMESHVWGKNLPD